MVDVGQIVSGKYKLLRLLGDGGMGAVYEAEHLGLGTHVAIKVLHTELARRPGLVERFVQEARVSAQIRSPHVVHVTDVDRTPDGIAYLVMELLQGEPLSNVVRREKRLGPGTASEYTLQILQALEAAHALGVIHRDLKPDNVFVTFEGGRPILKLIDFGIAKLKRAEGGTTKNLTVAGMLMGTPEYMAPEQAYAADKVDVRADIYAVGVMLYEMLSGTTPVTGDDPRVLVFKVERGEITPLVHAAPGTAPELAGLVHRAMAPRPEMRFSSATEMRLALEAVQGKRAGTAKFASPAAVGPVAAVPAHAALAPAPAPNHFAPAPAFEPPREAAGTGTVMGAPLGSAMNGGANVQLSGSTVRAAPIDDALRARMAATPYESAVPPPMTNHGTHGTGRRSGGGLIVGLAVVALLLGAGAVVAYVLGTNSTSASTTPIVGPLTTTPAVTAPAAPTTGVPTTPGPVVTVTSAPPLNAGPQVRPTTPTGPGPSTKPTTPPSSSTNPPTSPSSTVQPPPFVFPSIPSGFPSAIPLPSGFPSAIPLPSGFPTIQWPPMAPPPSQPSGQ
ncbi:Serine/threonine protein kinase [Labilithrix luteola]|uniref:Serine/threonine protein kinase n=1 Tax=Labilithrix luteola TaxID=1391654 RepID=A0A0K1QCT1_9BACT|nr:Serine/threonine protein kinase [Labilithrix luteola]